MIEQMKQLCKRIDARGERERALLALCIFAVIVVIGMNLVIAPMQKNIALTTTKHKQNEERASILRQQIETLRLNQKADIDAEVKHQITEYERQNSSLLQQLREYENKLVPAAEMDVLLERVLKQNKSLRLISLKSFPVVNVLQQTTPDVSDAGPASMPAVTADPELRKSVVKDGLFKHEVELVVEGNYLDLLSYLQGLESLPQRLYWKQSHLRVVEYPQSRLVLRVFTLSLEDKWLDL